MAVKVSEMKPYIRFTIIKFPEILEKLRKEPSIGGPIRLPPVIRARERERKPPRYHIMPCPPYCGKEGRPPFEKPLKPSPVYGEEEKRRLEELERKIRELEKRRHELLQELRKVDSEIAKLRLEMIRLRRGVQPITPRSFIAMRVA